MSVVSFVHDAGCIIQHSNQVQCILMLCKCTFFMILNIDTLSFLKTLFYTKYITSEIL